MLENKIHQAFSVSSNWAIYSSSNEINGSQKHFVFNRDAALAANWA